MKFLRKHYKTTSLLLFALALVYFDTLQQNVLEEAKAKIVDYTGIHENLEIDAFEKYASITLFIKKKIAPERLLRYCLTNISTGSK